MDLFTQTLNKIKPKCIVVNNATTSVFLSKLLVDENEAQINAFVSRHPEFSLTPGAQLAVDAGLEELARFSSPHGAGLRFSPAASGTDGFFVAILRKAGGIS